MLIEKLVSYCDAEYQSKGQCNCTYGEHCPDGHCDRCLHYIHTPSDAPAPRKYDCSNMANYYTCKYAYKYTSELIYALRQLRDLHDKKRLNVMSVGCGPCTELFALDYLQAQDIYQFETIEFRGIDLAMDVWGHIHKQIKQNCKDGIKARFFYEDITVLIDSIADVDWTPDLIVFQYVFSDMQKHCEPIKLREFIAKIAAFVNEKMQSDTYILLNDINLSIQYEGGREHFDALLNRISSSLFKRWHFNNNNRNAHYNYGDEYPTNELIICPPESILEYEPFDSCASAQMIIKKVNP